MNVSRRRYMGEKGGNIPYQKIVYLESTGQQYIILSLSGIVANVFFEVSGKVSTSNGASQKYLIYASNYTTFNIKGYSLSLYSTVISGNANSGGIGIGGGDFNEFALSTEGKTLNGVFTQLARPIKSNYTFNSLTIFGTDSAKIAWLKVRIGNNIVYDLIPVRIGTTGYMYDKVSGELFGNSGTGDFVLGPDIN